MESFGDKARAFGLALGLHGVLLLALLAGLWWTQATRPVTMPGPVIEATLVGPTAAPKPRAGSTKPAPPAKPRAEPKPAPKPEPKPAPPKPAAPTPAEVQRQDLVEREKVAALAREQAEQARREEEARVRQQQVLLEQEEKERKQRAEKEKQLAEIRAARAAAEKKLKLEKERLAQLEDRNRREAQQASPAVAEHEAEQAQTGAGGADDDLAARYSAAIQAVVTQNWNRPESAQAGLRCVLDITQIPGGEVISAAVASPCNADPATRRSIEQAVLRAAPLPYQGYEKVFQRRITFTFRYDGQD